MSKRALLFLTTGFEETEAIVTADILRRGGVNVEIISLTGSKTVCGSRGVSVVADKMFDNISDTTDMLILPGGNVVDNYISHAGLVSLFRNHIAKGGLVAAICAAPVFLSYLGIIDGKNVVCYPSRVREMMGYGAPIYTDADMVVDLPFITGRGPGLTVDFALKVLEVLASKDDASDVAEKFLWDIRQF